MESYGRIEKYIGINNKDDWTKYSDKHKEKSIWTDGIKRKFLEQKKKKWRQKTLY